MTNSQPQVQRGAIATNREHFAIDLREAVMAFRKETSEKEQKDLDLKISDLIKDLDYL